MQKAYRLTRKDGAPGIDGVTADDYATNLDANLLDLLDRIKSGRYQAPPVRRAYIPKTDGSRRPLGIPTFEDKVAQRAIVMVLETVYEQDFLPCSFGFRPGRSAHQALQYLRTGFMSQGLRWVIDIEKYFDSIPHSQLRDFLDQRVTDGVIRWMIDKWLKAGVLEDDLLRHTADGSPQGGVISPCLSNIFLHHVLDDWFEHDVRPRLKGRCTLVRFADDAVMAFEHVLDAQRVLLHTVDRDRTTGTPGDRASYRRTPQKPSRSQGRLGRRCPLVGHRPPRSRSCGQSGTSKRLRAGVSEAWRGRLFALCIARLCCPAPDAATRQGTGGPPSHHFHQLSCHNKSVFHG